MIEYLRGRLAAVTPPGRVVIEVAGVGLGVETPASSWGSLSGQVGREITLYTKLILKEDGVSLYGFSNRAELNLFNLITGVSGFGPRLALALLGSFTPSQLCLALIDENIPLLCQAPGVGRKGAQRLVLELKEKLSGVMEMETAELSNLNYTGAISLRDEITEALCALGYSRMEAAAAVKSVSAKQEDLSREDFLKLALKSAADR